MNTSLWCILVSVSVCWPAMEDWGEDDVITELIVEVTSAVEDCPRKSQNGDTISIHYMSSLTTDGAILEDSYRRGKPFVFQLGAGKVIKGLDQGLVGMCVGEKRTLMVPHTLAYGEKGLPPKIPAKASLLYQMELVNIGHTGKDEL